MSKQITLNILSKVKDMTENVLESSESTDVDKQLLKDTKKAIEWVKSIKDIPSSDDLTVCCKNCTKSNDIGDCTINKPCIKYSEFKLK